jgi:hypothetical protein
MISSVTTKLSIFDAPNFCYAECQRARIWAVPEFFDTGFRRGAATVMTFQHRHNHGHHLADDRRVALCFRRSPKNSGRAESSRGNY